MKMLLVEMPDGSEWVVPASVIANNRAAYYASAEDQREDKSRVWDDECKFTMKDGYELMDWARNNMNWADVKDAARQDSFPKPCDYEDGWANGDMRVVSDD